MPPKHIALAMLFFAFIACSGNDTLTYGGQTYKTVKIGEQVWMAENLNYEAEGSVCYDNKPDNCAKYGRLYNWETAKKVCPKGWHLPSNAEWDKLLRFVDGDTGTENPYKSETAGKYLKAKSGWNSWNIRRNCNSDSDSISGNGTDIHGFSALPGGAGYSDGKFNWVGYSGEWWSVSESGSDLAYPREMPPFGQVYWSYSTKSSLFSVRCLQD
jgi:uncharacterized protein (TIGR02145 family)